MENKLLTRLRELRNFQVEDYLERKVKAINEFFTDNNLDAAVIGLSGGVDSALTILLLKKASEVENSPIKMVLGVFAPIYGDGTTGQDEATLRVYNLVDNHKLHWIKHDLTQSYKEFKFNDMNPWENGQMASVLRTPSFYYNAAILQSKGYKSLVVGTTNRDEGSYIGFFGKASDVMVDLQIISDIHKSEVYQLAKLLKVPQSIIDEKPRGDVWDNRIDEEMIGAPYWFLEMYLLMKEYGSSIEDLDLYGDENEFIKYSHNIEDLHNKNAHKYKVGNPAHFIDVMNRKIPGGW